MNTRTITPADHAYHTRPNQWAAISSVTAVSSNNKSSNNRTRHPTGERLPGNKQRLILTTLVLLAVITTIDATYMHAKAKLAQILIERSWHKGQLGTRPWPWADTWPVAKITAPSVELEAWVLAGASGHALSFGPGMADGSVAIGEPGVTMIAGHRDTSFQPLQYLVIGDSISLENDSGQSFHYRITGISIADARYSAIATQTTDATLILVTCYPFNALTAGGPLRYVVQAKLVADSATAQQSTGTLSELPVSITYF